MVMNYKRSRWQYFLDKVAFSRVLLYVVLTQVKKRFLKKS